jgi:hypothetical protein
MCRGSERNYFATLYTSETITSERKTIMCMCEIVRIGSKVGVFSFTTGYAFKPAPSLIEWAKRDFDACFTYLFRNGHEETAEELFNFLERTVSATTRSR